MRQNHYLVVGHSQKTPGLLQGISIYRYDPNTAAVSPVGQYDTSLKIGNQIYDSKRHTVYAVDEYWSLAGQTGGGGHVVSLSLDGATGHLTRTSMQRAFGTNPSYVALDKTGRYLLVTHHCTEHFVTRMVKTDGGYGSETLYDLCTLLLYRVMENGEIGPIADAFEVHGHDLYGEHRFPHLHCVVPDHERNFFLVCDKGLDKIYSFRIDYEKEKLVKCGEVDGEPGSEPRYGNFHPTKPIFYSNCEGCADVNIYRLDTDSGEICLLGTCESVRGEASVNAMPSDIVLHPDGKYVYTSLRRENLISVLEILDDSTLVRRQLISSGGDNPRGLCVSPDGRFLFAANVRSGVVQCFSIDSDGTLAHVSCLETGGTPGNIQIVTALAEE